MKREEGRKEANQSGVGYLDRWREPKDTGEHPSRRRSVRGAGAWKTGCGCLGNILLDTPPILRAPLPCKMRAENRIPSAETP